MRVFHQEAPNGSQNGGSSGQSFFAPSARSNKAVSRRRLCTLGSARGRRPDGLLALGLGRILLHPHGHLAVGKADVVLLERGTDTMQQLAPDRKLLARNRLELDPQDHGAVFHLDDAL